MTFILNSNLHLGWSKWAHYVLNTVNFKIPPSVQNPSDRQRFKYHSEPGNFISKKNSVASKCILTLILWFLTFFFFYSNMISDLFQLLISRKKIYLFLTFIFQYEVCKISFHMKKNMKMLKKNIFDIIRWFWFLHITFFFFSPLSYVQTNAPLKAGKDCFIFRNRRPAGLSGEAGKTLFP